MSKGTSIGGMNKIGELDGIKVFECDGLPLKTKTKEIHFIEADGIYICSPAKAAAVKSHKNFTSVAGKAQKPTKHNITAAASPTTPKKANGTGLQNLIDKFSNKKDTAEKKDTKPTPPPLKI